MSKTWLCPSCHKELVRVPGETKRTCPKCGAEMVPYAESDGNTKRLKNMEERVWR